MKYCSNCGSDQLVKRVPLDDNLPRVCCDSCDTVHYKNPRMIVGCLPIWEDKILLAKRAIEPQKGLWGLPAGFMEKNETAEQGALRELYEETKAEGEIIRLHCCYSLVHVGMVYMHFLTHLNSDRIEKTVESTEVAFFSADEIPWEQLAFSSSEFALQKYLEEPNNEKVHLGTFDPKLLNSRSWG